MIIAIDIGNTSCGIAFIQGKEIVYSYSTKTNINKTYEEYESSFKEFLVANNLIPTEIEGAIMSSVVPSLTSIWDDLITKFFKTTCFHIGPRMKTGIHFNIDNPQELGADLVCDIAAGLEKYGNGTLIVDLGTATKYLIIDEKGVFQGAIITPGMKLSFEALTKGTALLSSIELSNPKNVIGKNTKECLNSGIINGTVYEIEGFTRDIESQLNIKLNKVITGGYSKYLVDKLKGYIFDKNLLFDGLRILFCKNNK